MVKATDFLSAENELRSSRTCGGKDNKKQRDLTVSRPCSLPTCQRTPVGTWNRVNRACLEPYIPRWLPGVNISTIRNAGHIKLHWTEVGDGGHGDKAELFASGHSGVTRARFHLEAAHVGTVDISDAKVSLVVLGLANGLPFFGFGLAIDDELGEAV